MGMIPGTLETENQPPMTVPLRHFVVGLVFLFVGAVVGTGHALGAVPGLAGLAHVHLLLVGWICVTIMGAMTQFVPVWSGAALHSRRLARVQLSLIVIGLLGFALGLISNTLELLVPFGGLMLAGFWIFVYNIARTMATIDDFDVTERHFLIALLFFLVLTVLGLALAIDFSIDVFGPLPVSRTGIVGAHMTIAVFGAVLTTVYGALYQLGTMFTQTELHGVDHSLRSIEETAHPIGVVLLAGGRLGDGEAVALLGAALVLGAAVAFATILARKLSEMQVAWTPMHTRYALVVPGLFAWALTSAPAWFRDATHPTHLFGAPGSGHLLLLATIGFVVLGTLYHIIPFIIWVHRYSDQLGFEDVPMIDDLYNERLAAADATLIWGGTLGLILSDWFLLDSAVFAIAGASVTIGIVAFTTNMLVVIRDHSPHSVGFVLLGALDPRDWGESVPPDEAS
jgi:hypothetical protein